MAPTPNIVRLPNGQNLTVLPVFGGYFFKANELNVHNSVFPAGWTVIIQSEDYSDEHASTGDNDPELSGMPKEKRHHIHPYKHPTLHNDNLFISSISNPSSQDFKTPTSPTRQIAMMLWASLYWYFHQTEPSPYLATEASKNTPDEGKPRGEWRINIKREGVLRGRNLIQKLERMGLIVSEDSTVGINPEENTADGWSEMFISRRMFWQISPKLFLFTLRPAAGSPFPTTPYGSRPTSPVRGERNHSPITKETSDHASTQPGSPGLWSPGPHGPFSSGSHLPTYYPPPPLQYTMTSGIRHPLRPKPPRQGEIFYTRFVSSIGQYLSFRTASLSPRPVAYSGPTSTLQPPLHHHTNTSLLSLPAHISVSSIPDPSSSTPPSEKEDTQYMTDAQLLNKWMNMPRVSKFWGCSGPQSTQDTFLQSGMTSKHSFPVIGLWDGKPFGYFEIYWIKEDILGRHLGERAGEHDRGIHVLVGEEEFRGKSRVKCWVTALAHWAFVQDYRTNSVVLEPRVDNTRFISTLSESGFLKEGEITFPHKQSAFMSLRREIFEGPAL
ncbi:siderophore biosynthesis protein-like protein [Bisporella sp. PMI_857]|nr:siderophore biosynthesis protein-like protein [Bisporella sp. PMI_857]